MSRDDPVLHVYQTGPTTVIGFRGEDVLDDVNVAVYRDEMVALIELHKCETFGVDLTGVKLVPSGLLGLLASIRRRGVDVHLYNPSPDVREVLSVTNLDRLMPIHNIPVNFSTTDDDEPSAD
ncbi:MAG: anti-sigma factor antagonist [Planctomycetota bacterium]|nr:MAG: anti-sigma factor antagonist [Planctomycetota bacterium]REK19984.1 MAG: anti-sigma factor antagonist [Planctomycetota bacterium]REK27551.1 MAG: anti-sigma factor antagonist [Planctomycetota bacterium]